MKVSYYLLEMIFWLSVIGLYLAIRLLIKTLIEDFNWLGWYKWRTKYCYWFGRFTCAKCTRPKPNTKVFCKECEL